MNTITKPLEKGSESHYTAFWKSGYTIFGLHGIHKDGTCECGSPDCKAIGKHPRTRQWQYTEHFSEDQLTEMEADGFFQSGYGILIQNGLLVVDVDARNGGVESYARLIEQVPEIAGAGLIVETGSGNGSKHLFFKTSASGLKSKLPDYPGIDFKHSGFVVGVGSNHKSGKKYEILIGSPEDIGEAPQDLVNLLQHQSLLPIKKNKTCTLDELAKMLSYLDPDLGHDDWIGVGMALHYETNGSEDGFKLFDSWSSTATRFREDGTSIYPGQCELAKRWNSFRTDINHPITIKTLINLARQRGYQAPSHPGINLKGGTEQTSNLPNFCEALQDLPGGLGMIQQYIYNQMIYPDLALAAFSAFGYLSHLGQNRFKIKSMHGDLALSEYYLILARTTFGKESIRRGLENLVTTLSDSTKKWGKAINFKTKGANLQFAIPTSAQGLHKLLEANPAQTFLSDEFGEFLIQASKKGDSHKQAAIGYLMELYTKTFSQVCVPNAVTRNYAIINNPRITIIGTTTGERLLESLTLSQAESGTYNRFIPFVTSQERIDKKYQNLVFEPSEKMLEWIDWLLSQDDDQVINFTEEALDYYVKHDSTIIEPIKFEDPILAGRLSEQALKLSAQIAISDQRLEITRSDLALAYSIRLNLYNRAKIYFDNEKVLSGSDDTVAAYEQITDVIARKKTISISRLKDHSRKYAKLKIYEQRAVLDMLQRNGIVTSKLVKGGCILIYTG